jgi:benzoyl-CoA reductase/2-hydroxyglutaryl-CoA dehydratase subunit BcrC/BadD/HgdB
MEEAERRGLSQDLCSYARNTLGYMYNHKNLDLPYPGGGLPDPDFLLLDNGSCTSVHNKWWRIMEDYYKVPLYMLDIPILTPTRMNRDHVERHYIDFVISQIKGCFAFLEEQTGKRMDVDRFKEVVRLADRIGDLFDQFLELRKVKPCPVGGEDAIALPAIMVYFTGTQTGVDFFEKLIKETQDRVRNGEGVVQDEKFRLLVDNIPPFYSLGLFNYFQKYGGVSVAETYILSFNYNWRRMEADQPFESLAKKYLAHWYTLPLEEHIDIICNIVKEYDIDGVVCLALRSCKVYTLDQWTLKNTLERKYGIPTIILEMDMVDPRAYADRQTNGRIDAFMEVLDKKKYG